MAQLSQYKKWIYRLILFSLIIILRTAFYSALSESFNHHPMIIYTHQLMSISPCAVGVSYHSTIYPSNNFSFYSVYSLLCISWIMEYSTEYIVWYPPQTGEPPFPNGFSVYSTSLASWFLRHTGIQAPRPPGIHPSIQSEWTPPKTSNSSGHFLPPSSSHLAVCRFRLLALFNRA